MAFTVNDLGDLLKLLRERPEWREEVRREVLGDELLALPELVRQNSIDIQKLTESMDQLTEAVNKLVTWSGITDARLARMSGYVLELWYRDHPGLLGLLHRLRRIRVPELAALDLLEDAVDAGLVSEDEFGAIYRADLIIAGREGSGDAAHDAMLAVEVSSKINMYDVRRAEERAAILRKAGYAAHPVVAGHEVDEITAGYLDERGIRYHLKPDEGTAAAS
ncbi:MAG: hypothetical protein WD557_12210 [Dehalococcoidia bacterium]